jgi:hypothetical protein
MMLFNLTLSRAALAVASTLALTACATTPSTEPSRLTAEATKKAQSAQFAPRTLATVSRVTASEDIHIPVALRKVSEFAWLRDKKITIGTSREPVPMTEILRALSKQGLSITSELPLDRFLYSGFSLTDINAESALRAIVSSVGLDYKVDDARQLIIIKPLSSKTWYLNIGNRRSNFTSGGTTSTAVAKGGLGADSGLSSGGSGNVTSVNSSDDFWPSLRTELDSRLRLMLPEPPKAQVAAPVTAAAAGVGLSLPPAIPVAGVSVAGLPPMPGTPGAAAPSVPVAPAPATAGVSEGLLNFTSKQVGSFSVNPETGAVTVQAPHWILDDLSGYFKRIQEMYNTDIMFQGELILLTSSDSKAEGLDITTFAKFAKDNYGLAYSNNGLGGVTLSRDAQGTKVFSAAAAAVAGPMLGLVSATDSLAVFNAYLTNLGNVTTLQRPMLTTTSGVPADFRRIVTRYFNSVSQESTPGAVGTTAIVTTKNTLIAQDFGTVLRVNPRVDISTGLIRAQIELVQTTQTGTQSLPQAVSSGSSVQLIPAQLPIISKVIYSGETLLKDGDLVVMGGQVEDEESVGREGVTGLMDAPGLSSVFGKNTTAKKHNVFYFALRVSVKKR